MSKLRSRGLAAMAATVACAVPVTLALAASSTAPTVASAAASAVTDTGATLNGTVNPNGTSTQYAFQWGPTAVTVTRRR